MRKPPAIKRRLVGYARVSTEEQLTDAQVDELKAAGCAVIYQEHASGASRARPELARLMAEIQRGDVLTVVRLDRLIADPAGDAPRRQTLHLGQCQPAACRRNPNPLRHRPASSRWPRHYGAARLRPLIGIATDPERSPTMKTPSANDTHFSMAYGDHRGWWAGARRPPSATLPLPRQRQLCHYILLMPAFPVIDI